MITDDTRETFQGLDMSAVRGVEKARRTTPTSGPAEPCRRPESHALAIRQWLEKGPRKLGQARDLVMKSTELAQQIQSRAVGHWGSRCCYNRHPGRNGDRTFFGIMI